MHRHQGTRAYTFLPSLPFQGVVWDRHIRGQTGQRYFAHVMTAAEPSMCQVKARAQTASLVLLVVAVSHNSQPTVDPRAPS